MPYASIAYMPRKKKKEKTAKDEQLQASIDTIGGDREPRIKIYRIESAKRQTQMGVFSLDEFSGSSVEQRIADKFGSGKFLVRTVDANGRYGPSRVIRIDARNAKSSPGNNLPGLKVKHNSRPRPLPHERRVHRPS